MEIVLSGSNRAGHQEKPNDRDFGRYLTLEQRLERSADLALYRHGRLITSVLGQIKIVLNNTYVDLSAEEASGDPLETRPRMHPRSSQVGLHER